MESTLIHPCREGDVQLVYDLDELSIGYFDMEIDAPEGTVVDAYFVEHIEDGHIQIPRLLRNGFRFVCQEGQNYFMAGRRLGMRFAMLVFRQFNRPLKLQRIGVVETTYPDSSDSRFVCSDERLNRIYEISRRTLLLCMEDTFTDCPTYEQVLWIGDAVLEDGNLSPSVSRHTSMLALLYDIVPDEHREAAIRNTLEGRDGMVDVGSPFAMSFSLQCFEKLGAHETILQIIWDYWGLMLDHGARNCWECIDEAWRAGKAEWPTRSRCHGWSASPVEVFTRILLGVRPLKPGFVQVAVNPIPCGLSHAKGRVPTPHGSIEVEWHARDDGSLDLRVEAPAGVAVRRSS